MTSCADAYKGSQISRGLSRIGQITQGDSLSAQGWSELNGFANNPFTHKSGIVVKQLSGRDHVVIDMTAVPRKERPSNTIPGLAKTIKDTDKRVLNTILNHKGNAWLLPSLYRQTRGDIKYPGDTSARRYLARVANQEYRPGNGLKYAIRYKKWALPIEAGKSIVLPEITPTFKCDVFHFRLRAQSAKLRDLRKRAQHFVETIRKTTKEVKDNITSYDKTMQPYLNDIAAITACRTLMDLMMQHPASSNQSYGPDMRNLHKEVKTFESTAIKNFITSPPKKTWPETHKSAMESSAKRLRKIFEDKELIKIIMTYRRYRYLITTTLFDQLCVALSEAIILLMRSPQTKYIKDNWMNRLLNLVDKDSQLQNNAEAKIEVGDAPTACDALVTALSVFPAAAGNMPGPASFSVAMMNSFSHQLVGKALANPTQAKNLASILVRFLVRRGGLNATHKTQLEQMLKKPPTEKTIGYWIKNRFQGSANWGLLLGIFNAGLLMYSISSSESKTVKDWITLGNVSLASSSAASFVQALKAVERLRASGLVTLTGEALGVMAGVFAVLSSVEAARAESATGDSRGAAINYAAAFGAGLSVAGYFIGAGLAADATVFGAPLGAVLMAIGVVIGVVAAIWGFIRSWTTTYTHMQFEAFINYLSDRKGSKVMWDILKYHKSKYRQLSASYQYIQTKHHNIEFWYIHHSQHEVLYKDIFRDCEQVAHALDMSEKELKRLYPKCC